MTEKISSSSQVMNNLFQASSHPSYLQSAQVAWEYQYQVSMGKVLVSTLVIQRMWSVVKAKQAKVQVISCPDKAAGTFIKSMSRNHYLVTNFKRATLVKASFAVPFKKWEVHLQRKTRDRQLFKSKEQRRMLRTAKASLLSFSRDGTT